VSRNGCTTSTTNPNTTTWVGNGETNTWERAGTLPLSSDGQTMTGTTNRGFNAHGVGGC
jgi:hypothetical protein